MRRYYAEMKYEIDGKEYVFEYLISTIRPYEIGKEYLIMYNPDNPSQHVMANKERTIMIICSVMAAIVMFLGLGLLAAAIDKLKKRYVPRRKVKSQDTD